jgi:hypothetical protein
LTDRHVEMPSSLRARPLKKTLPALLQGWWIVSAAIVAVGAAGCAGRTAAPEATPTSLPAPSAVPSAAPTPFPWILIGSETPPDVQESVQAWASDMGVDSRVEAMAPAAGPPAGLMAVIATGKELAGAAESWAQAGVDVIVLDGADVAPAPTLSTVGPGRRDDQTGFLAGLAAGMATRSGFVGLLHGSTENAAAFESGFDAGLRYLCARCQWQSLGSVGDLPFSTDVVAVAPGSSLPAGGAPDGAPWLILVDPQTTDGTERVAARVAEAPATVILQALEALTSGQPGQAWIYDAANGGLILTAMNPEAITPGRERLVDDAVIALREGTLIVGGGE